MDPADGSPGGLVGLGRADRDGQSLAWHELDVADVERGQFRAAGQQGEAKQHDGPVPQARRRLRVAGRHDHRKVGGHHRHRLARSVAPVACGLPALRGDNDLARGQTVGRHRSGASVHGPNGRQVRVNRCRLQSAIGREVGQVRRDGLRGGGQRDSSGRRAPCLERAPARPVGQRGVLRYRLRDQRHGGVRHLEVGLTVPADLRNPVRKVARWRRHLSASPSLGCPRVGDRQARFDCRTRVPTMVATVGESWISIARGNG
jgi:hypothetical protein